MLDVDRICSNNIEPEISKNIRVGVVSVGITVKSFTMGTKKS